MDGKETRCVSCYHVLPLDGEQWARAPNRLPLIEVDDHVDQSRPSLALDEVHEVFSVMIDHELSTEPATELRLLGTPDHRDDVRRRAKLARCRWHAPDGPQHEDALVRPELAASMHRAVSRVPRDHE